MLTAPTCRACTRELAGDVQRLAVLVENRELLQAHLLGLEIDPRVQAGVRHAAGGNAERAALDVDESLQVRILAGAGDADVGLERAGDVGDLRREALDDAEVQRRRLDVEVDGVASRTRRRARPVPGLNSVIGTVPLAVIASVGDCCSVASRPMRRRCSRGRRSSDWYL